MRLESFRVQNYKKIRDTGWINCRDLTVFVGKNEAGKSAIFRGLSKLNPSDGQTYDGLKEFPRRRFTDEFSSQDWPAASGKFLLNAGEQEQIRNLCPALAGVTSVVCTRHYSSGFSVEFGPSPTVPVPLREGLVLAVTSALEVVRELEAPEGKGDAVGAIKTSLLGPLSEQKGAHLGQPSKQAIVEGDVTPVLNMLSAHANEAWQKELLEPAIAPVRALAESVKVQQQIQTATKWAAEHLPKFVYFDRYDVLDSAVHLPTFVQQVGSSPGAPKVRTTRCLFEHVGLDIAKLAGLGRHDAAQGEDVNIRRHIDERAIHFSSASNAMTQKFSDWWEQRKHKFRYQADGNYFRVWVSDDLDPSEIELDQRSQGMQYFFSFFIVFLVEAQGAHRDSILLLDEPGIHMHGTAQAKIVEFMEKLSKDNQTLYSTHSPFMIDVDHLERARAVYEASDGTTKVSEDVWPRDKDTLFPLQAALGYQLAQSLFIAKRQVIVEGLSDLWLIKALSIASAQRGLPTLRPDVIPVPAAGVTKLLPLASMLIGHDVEIAALLDGDEPGRREGKKLVEKLLSSQPQRCLFIGDFVPNTQAEIEDIFPEDEYFSAVHEAYPGIDLDFTKDEETIAGVVNRVEALFARKGFGKLEKWKPAAVLRDRIVANPGKVAAGACEVMARIAERLNTLLPAT